MIRQVPEEFQRELQQFNEAQGGPARVEVCWHPKKERWCVYAVPQNDSAHPLARNDMTAQLLTNYPDGSDRRGVLLCTWQGKDEEYLPLDNRVFEALIYADSFRDKQHMKHTLDDAAERQDREAQSVVRDIAKGAADYWKHFGSRTLVGVNTDVKSTGDWRASRWWH